jgi:hypothetical protein
MSFFAEKSHENRHLSIHRPKSALAKHRLDGQQLLEQRLEAIEMESVGAVGLGVGGIVVNFEEDTVDAGGDGGARKDGNELGLAAGDSVGGGGCLDGVRGVEDDRGERPHDRQRTHIHHEIVIAEAGAALGEEDARVAGGGNFLNGVLHIFGRNELPLLHIDGTTGFAGRDEQVGLATEEGGNLEDIAGLCDGGAVGGLVHVGEDGEVCLFRDAPQNTCAFDEAGTAEARDGGAIGFVVGGLEDIVHAEIAGDALDGIGHHAGVLLAFDDAGAGDEEELSAADGDAADFEVVLGHRERILGPTGAGIEDRLSGKRTVTGNSILCIDRLW